MKKSKIALIIGNGFSMNFNHHTGLVSSWDSQKPLSWYIECPSTKGDFLNSLPSLKKLKEEFDSLPDFDVFAKTLDESICERLDIDPFITPLEARHFLTIAFSNYSLQQTKLLKENTSWPWYEWIQHHRDEIKCAFSLNYDLLLECVFDEISKEYFSLQTNHQGRGIPLVKPHGSVDFEISPDSVMYSPIYPLQNFVDLNNTPIIRLDLNNLIYPRSQPLCIIPNEANKYRRYQWVAPANAWFMQELAACTHCVFVGISYMECDRPEINSIIDNLSNSTQIIIANPDPSIDFLEKVKGRPVVKWQDYAGPINADRELLVL